MVGLCVALLTSLSPLNPPHLVGEVVIRYRWRSGQCLEFTTRLGKRRIQDEDLWIKSVPENKCPQNFLRRFANSFIADDPWPYAEEPTETLFYFYERNPSRAIQKELEYRAKAGLLTTKQLEVWNATTLVE